MFFVATRKVVLVVYTTWRTRSVTHTQSRTGIEHGLLIGLMDDHGVKYILSRLITARHLENIALYVVLSNMLN